MSVECRKFIEECRKLGQVGSQNYKDYFCFFFNYQIINLCVNDIGRVHQAVTSSSVLVAVPILIFLVVGATIVVLGPAALVGALTVIFFLFIVVSFNTAFDNFYMSWLMVIWNVECKI